MPADPKKPKKPPHNKKHIDPKQVERMAMIGCTRDEIAHILGVAVATLDKRIDDGGDPEVANAWHYGRASGKETLRRWQWHLAEAGNPTMLIWLGKQMLHQSDKRELTGKDGSPLIDNKPSLTMTDAQLEAIAAGNTDK